MVKSRKQTLTINLVLAGLILITYFIYFPPFADAFVGDDYIQFDYIKEFLHRPFAAIQLFNPYHLSWYYRPIQNIWFLLNRLILGLNPFGYYVVQLPLHALAVALVYRVGRRFKLSPLAAVCSAAIFAIHSHHVDVVTWISSVAIVMAAVFSLLALNSWLGYLKRPSNKHLFLTLLFCLLTILSHEEGILLLPFLFLMMVMWRLEMRDWKLKDWAKTISKKESIIFLLLFVIFIGYLVIQLTRPNVTLDITARSSGEWFDYLAWAEIAEFILVTVFRFTFAFPVLSLSGIPAELFVIAVLALFGWWAWRGSLVVRLGLAWTAVHLFFIYWALWTNLPTLYAGRHIYQAGIGLVLAIGAGIDGLLGIGDWRLEIKKPFNLQSPISNLVIIFFVVAAALHHINQTRESQEIWVNNATEEKVAEAQLKEILPQISEADHIFSYRFPIAPDFTRAVAQLWYDVPLSRPGGGLDHLRAYGRATRHFYLFDYEEGQVYNLMPELQAHDETIFLWAGSSQTEVLNADWETAVSQITETPPDNDNTLYLVDADEKNQLTIKLQPPPTNDQWVARVYTVTPPENSELNTAVLRQPGLTYQIRIVNGDQESFIDIDTEQQEGWEEISVPLQAYWNRPITIYLGAMVTETATDTAAYWANPRLVVNNP